MTLELKNELTYAGRFLFRDNPLLVGRVAAELAANERRSPEELDAIGQRKLHATLQRAIEVLPYYRGMARDFSVAEARDALRQFPIVEKATLVANPTTLYPHGGAKKPWEAIGKTSGTSGAPLTIYRSPTSVLYEQEFIKRHWSWGGYRQGMNRATLRGDLAVPIDRKQPPYWFFNRYNRQLILSSRHLNDRCIDPIIDRLAEYKADMLQAYPSAAYTLALYLAKRGRKLDIPVVFTGSEPVYGHQKDAIVGTLAHKIMDMYGMAERVAFATQCEHGNMHLNQDYSHVEILDDNGNPTDDYGFVVGTTYHNHAQPLVRYRLSDRTKWKPGRCACGRPFPMIEEVTGKYEDFITGSNGMAVSPSVLTFAFKYARNIKRSQVAQVGQGKWEVRLVPDTGWSEADRELLMHNLRTMVDAEVDVDLVYKDDLPNTAAGKFRWVVNETT